MLLWELVDEAKSDGRAVLRCEREVLVFEHPEPRARSARGGECAM